MHGVVDVKHSGKFGWFVLSMRMQVILDSPIARPGSAPIGGGKKGEFRDWTRSRVAGVFWTFQLSEDSAEFRYVPLHIADQVVFRCFFYKNFTLLHSKF